jgi:hypothetical protein
MLLDLFLVIVNRGLSTGLDFSFFITLIGVYNFSEL